MNDAPLTILGLAGSLRRDSFNRRVLEQASTLLSPRARIEPYEDLGAIPHFDQDLEGDRTPPEVLGLRDRIAATDAVLVATPEYNGGMPGVLKNALDWASRPSGESVLAGKPTAVLGASPGSRGAVRAQADARRVLSSIGADVLDQELAVAKVHEVLKAGGGIDADLECELTGFLASLVDLIPGPCAVEPTDDAVYSQACQELARSPG